jgi:hypothetical protein
MSACNQHPHCGCLRRSCCACCMSSIHPATSPCSSCCQTSWHQQTGSLCVTGCCPCCQIRDSGRLHTHWQMTCTAHSRRSSSNSRGDRAATATSSACWLAGAGSKPHTAHSLLLQLQQPQMAQQETINSRCWRRYRQLLHLLRSWHVSPSLTCCC